MKRSVGVSYPFLEQHNESLFLNYSSMKIEIVNDQITVIFLQEETPIMAYTHDLSPNLIIHLDDVEGKVQVNNVQK